MVGLGLQQQRPERINWTKTKNPFFFKDERYSVRMNSTKYTAKVSINTINIKNVMSKHQGKTFACSRDVGGVDEVCPHKYDHSGLPKVSETQERPTWSGLGLFVLLVCAGSSLLISPLLSFTSMAPPLHPRGVHHPRRGSVVRVERRVPS